MFGSTPFARYGHAGILVLLLASLIAVRFALPRRLTTAVGGS